MSMNDLEKEIEKIRYELAVTIPEELQNARYSGDILECSEYSEILTRQHLLSLRLTQLNRRLDTHQNLNLKKIPRTQVGIGSKVKLLCENTLLERYVQLVSGEISESISSDIEYEEVTLSSPVGKAIYNKCLGDNVLIKTPTKIENCKIIYLLTIHDL